jgi:hypothetical protein
MEEWAQDLVQRYRHRGVLVDANLFILLLVGAIAPDEIGDSPRVKQFTKADFDLLDRMLHRSAIVTTPNILTEVSNLSRGRGFGVSRRELQRYLASFIAGTFEAYVPSREAAAQAIFDHEGLSDAVCYTVARQGRLLITVDGKLARAVHSAGLDVINYNDFRPGLQ